MLVGGVLLAAATGLHLAIAQSKARRWTPKELSVALLYTAGIWYGPLLLATRRNAWTWLVAALHFLGVLLNLGMYAVLEEAVDRSEDSASVSRTAGAPAVRRAVVALTALGAAAAALGFSRGPVALAAAWAPLLLVVATPALLLAFPSVFVPRFRYRIVGELVFVVLALPLLLAG